MTANLVKAGHRLRVWNASEAPIAALGAAPAEAASAAEILRSSA